MMDKLTTILIVFIFLMVGTILIIMPSLVSAQLSDDTLEEVNRLSIKHYGHGLSLSHTLLVDQDHIADLNYEWISLSFEDGKLFVETSEGKWFIEMEKVEETK